MDSLQADATSTPQIVPVPATTGNTVQLLDISPSMDLKPAIKAMEQLTAKEIATLKAKLTKSELVQNLEPRLSKKHVDNDVCIACLGVLQKKFSSEAFLDSIKAQVDALNFEYTTFLCSVSLPVSQLIRDHCLYLLVRYESTFPSMIGETLI